MRYPDYLFLATRNGNPVNERVLPRKWQWKAVYNDGTELNQYEHLEETQDDKGNLYKGKFHQISEIDQSKLDTFYFINVADNISHSLKFNPSEMKLLCFYQTGRQFVVSNPETEEGSFFHYTLNCFGYETKVGYKVFRNIFKILPDNNIVITDDKELMIEFK